MGTVYVQYMCSICAVYVQYKENSMRRGGAAAAVAADIKMHVLK